MPKRRGFFAELQRQAALAERERQRSQAAAVREQQRQEREAESARKAAVRAQEAAKKADDRAKAAAEKEAKRLHVAAQEARAEAMCAELTSTLEDIDSVLSWTLDFDDHVNLEQFRQPVEHPPFTSNHRAPIPAPRQINIPPEPRYEAPPAPSGLGGMFGKKKYERAGEQARAAFAQQHAAWHAEAASVPMRQLEQARAHHAAEQERMSRLNSDEAAYRADCQRREAEVQKANQQLDTLLAALERGDKAAVEEYLGIVFDNSVYPDALSVEVEYSYRPEDKELEVAIGFPSPSAVPAARAFKYVKARDEITATNQTVKEQRDRYANLLWSIVLRILHEVWESDRLGHVGTIALTGGVEHVDPATGRSNSVPLVAVAVQRDDFEGLDLRRVTPVETLKYLNADMSKNPYAVTPISLQDGVRG